MLLFWTVFYKIKDDVLLKIMNMIELILSNAVLLISGLIVQGCNDTNRLPNLMLRARNVYVDGSRSAVHDFYISDWWYNLRHDGKQYLMPDFRTMPELQACDSYEPIYMNDTHPNFEDLPADGKPLDLVACMRTQFDICEYTFNIKVRKCGPDIHYFLQYTSQRSAYCFDPPHLQKVPGTFRALEDVNVGTIAVVPSLSFDESISGGIITYTPISIFKCNFMTDNYFYKVNWTINGKEIKAFEQSNSTGTSFEVSESQLLDVNISLPLDIQCGVYAAANQYGESTYLNSSSNYFVGLKVLNRSVNVSKGGYVEVSFQLTAPIGCFYTNVSNVFNTCVLPLEMVSLTNPRRCDTGNIAVVTNAGHCGPVINTTSIASLQMWTSDTVYTVKLTSSDVKTGDRREYQVALNFPSNYQHRLWASYRSTVIDVHIGKSKPHGVCYSRVNSQVRTTDGYCINANVLGDFILYWNKKYDIMVQQRTTYCQNNQTTCMCGLAIRAGRNVFVIDLCNSVSYMDYLMCEDVNTLEVELIQGTQNVHKIITPSGATVVADILQWPLFRGYMNVDIYLSAKDFEESRGLCGTYNGDMADDLIHQNGLSADLPNTGDCFLRRHSSFINSWRVDASNTLFSLLGRNNSAKWDSDKHTFCICGQSPNNTNVSGDAEQLSVGSVFDTIYNTHEEDKKHSSCVSNNGTTSRRNEIERLECNKNRAQLPDSNTTYQITVTRDDAESFCKTLVNNSFGGVEKLLEFARENLGSIEAHCAHVVQLYNDYTAITTMIPAIYANIQYQLDNDEVFVANNSEVVNMFVQRTCASKCNRETGACDSRGKCICKQHFHGDYCNIDDRVAPVITNLEGDGFYGSSKTNYSCFYVYFENLQRAFSCKINTNVIFINGSVTSVGQATVNGFYIDMFTGQCCVPEIAPIADAFVYGHTMSVTYDRIVFSDVRSMYIYQEICQEHVQSDSGLHFKLKAGFCLIDGQCVDHNGVDGNDHCMRCMPERNMYQWSYGCELQTTSESREAIVIGVVASGSVTFIGVAIVACYCCRKRRKRKEGHPPSANPGNLASDMYTSLDRTNTDNTYDEIGRLANRTLQLPHARRVSTTPYERLNNTENSYIYDIIQTEHRQGRKRRYDRDSS